MFRSVAAQLLRGLFPADMTAIWLLPTKGRPALCQQVLDTCESTRMRSPGVVYVDETVDMYQDIRLPANWTIHYAPRWGGIATAMQWVLKQWPDASQYGWIADDTFPRSRHWDMALERYAGDWKLAYGMDNYVSSGPWPNTLRYCKDLGAPLCWGGELVRAVGWWAFPGVKQAGIDTAWTALLSPLGLYHYAIDVKADHNNYRTGRREYDDTDSWVRNGVNYIQKDLDTRAGWEATADFPETMNRVKLAAGLK